MVFRGTSDGGWWQGRAFMMKDNHLLCCLLSLLSRAVLLLCGCFKATDIILYSQVRRVIDWDAVMGRPIAGGEHWLNRGIKE